MKRLALLLSLLLVLSLLSSCSQSDVKVAGLTVMQTGSDREKTFVEPVVVEEAPPEPEATLPPASEPEPVPEAPNEGDIDQSTLDQITSLEQSSSVRDDDVAPVEAEAYCTLTVSCEALLDRRDELSGVLLPPDGMFYSGTIVLTGGETALALIADTVNACGLDCQMDEDQFVQVAGIPGDLVEGMAWTVLCNGVPLDEPALYAIQSGDALLLAYTCIE